MGYFFNDAEKPLEGIKGYTKSVLDEIEKAFLTNFDVDAIKDKIAEVEEAATEVTKVFGQGKEQITALKAAMAEAVTSVTLLGGGFSDIVNLQTKISETLGTNLILNSQSYEKLYATTEVTGVKAGELTTSFKDAGFSVYAIGDQMTKVMNTAREIGVNGQAVSSQVVENMASMNQYNFQGGIEGMAKMAAQAVNLRTDMKFTLAMADRLFDPEQAIDMAAAMQRLGVAQGDLLDPLRLMDLARNDPAELQNQIAEMSKSFVKLKADGTGFEILPGEKGRMMEIEKAMQLPTGELGKMALAAGDLELKMSKIKFSNDVTDEKTQNLIANMAEMGEGGEYKVTYTDAEGDVQTKNVTELDENDIKAITEASEKAPKTMEDYAKGQLTTQQSIDKNIESIKDRTGLGLAGTKAATTAEDAARKVSGVLPKVADAYSIKSARENLGGNLDKFIKDVGDGKGMESLFTAVASTATYLETTLQKSWENTKTALDELTKSANPLIKIMEDIVKKTVGAAAEHENINVTEGTDFIKFPGETVKPLAIDTIFGMTKGKEALENLNSTNSNSVVGASNIKMEDVNVNLNIKIDAPSNVDTSQLMLAFNDPSVKGALIGAVQSALSNANGSNGSNPIVARKQMAKMANLG